jgi:hypothetical protein
MDNEIGNFSGGIETSAKKAPSKQLILTRVTMGMSVMACGC